MRDHRARAAVLMARHRRRVRPLRALDRVVRWPLTVRPTGRYARLDVYAHAALTVTGADAARPHRRRAANLVPVNAALAGVPAPAAPAAPHWAPPIAAAAGHRFNRQQIQATLRQFTVRANEFVAPARPRAVEHIRVVEREVAHVASATATHTGEATRADARSAWPAPPRMTPSPQAIEPAQLAAITDHVLTAIDRRLVAYGERLGRG